MILINGKIRLIQRIRFGRIGNPFRNEATFCSYSTRSKYVNSALSGKSNFEKDFNQCHIPTSAFQKLLLGLGSSFMSITDPRRGDMVAVMGEITGSQAFEYIHWKMLQSDEGRMIVEDKPRISSVAVDLEKLKQMPEGTLGKAYSNFLEKYDYTPDARPAVRFVDDFELAYIAQRYREAHDLFHTLLDMPTNMLGEVTVKWVEAIQTKLPMCVTGAIFGALRLAPKFFRSLTRSYSTGTIVVLDPQIYEGILTKEINPKRVSGKRGRRVMLPLDIETAIMSIISMEDAKKFHEESFQNKIYKHRLPLEGLRLEAKKMQIRQNILKKIRSSGNNEISEQEVNDIVNLRTNKALKAQINSCKVFEWNRLNCLKYLMSRAPYEYSAVVQIFLEISARDPAFKPETLLDFGSGVGTVTWAAWATWGESLLEYITVDSSLEMNKLAFRIIHFDEKKPLLKGLYQNRYFPRGSFECDLVISAFTLLHLNDFNTRLEMFRSLWDKTSRYLVFVENGTADGFYAVNEAKEIILDESNNQGQRCHVFAPCPHDLVCPRLSSGQPICHFLSSYRELRFNKEEVYNEKPYSYVILRKKKRDPQDKQWARVVTDVVKEGYFRCKMCTKHGKLEDVTITPGRHGKEIFRCAKYLKWGDLFPGDVISPNDRTKINRTKQSVSVGVNDKSGIS